MDITLEHHPDIVLLDLIIPEPENTVAEQGYDYLERVKANESTSTIPIIVFSNVDTIQDRIKCKELGAAAFLFKRDCTPQEVVDTVAEVVRRDRASKMSV
jgi:DNA-binding NarL/FixJ family response regulator